MDVVENNAVTSVNPIAAIINRVGWLLVLPILGFLCYSGPYIIGLSYRQTYLAGFNVPESLFESEARDYFVFAYLAVLETLKDISSFISDPKIWGASIITIIIAFLYLILINRLKTSSSIENFFEKIDRKNKYAGLLAALLILASLITFLMLVLPLLLLPPIVLPAAIGSYAAHQVINRDRVIYDQGCDHQAAPQNYCHAVMDGEKVIAVGFLLATSDKRIALYNDHRSKVIALRNYSLELVTPSDYPALIAANKIASTVEIMPSPYR